jgi:hypothetical protein
LLSSTLNFEERVFEFAGFVNDEGGGFPSSVK